MAEIQTPSQHMKTVKHTFERQIIPQLADTVVDTCRDGADFAQFVMRFPPYIADKYKPLMCRVAMQIMLGQVFRKTKYQLSLQERHNIIEKFR